MNLLAPILNDLREKRLWPIAVALLVALGAVPVLLSSSSAPPPLPPLPATSGPAPSSALPVVSVQDAPAHTRFGGLPHDPFHQQAAPAVNATATVTASSVGAAVASAGSPVASHPLPTSAPASPPAGAGATSPTTTSASTTPTTTTPTTTTPTGSTPKTTYLIYTVDLSFVKAGARPQVHHDVARLTPFPSTKEPLLVLLGVKSDGKTAVFLVSSLASPAGKGTCLPNPRDCEFLNLKAGQIERVLARNADGSLTEYALELTAIHVKRTPSPTQAKKAYLRKSARGARILARARKVSRMVRQVRYSVRTGLVSLARTRRATILQLVHVGRVAAGIGLALGGH